MASSKLIEGTAKSWKNGHSSDRLGQAADIPPLEAHHRSSWSYCSFQCLFIHRTSSLFVALEDATRGGGETYCAAQNVRWNAADGPGRTIKRTADAPSFEVTLANGRGRTDQDALQSCPASPLADGCTRGKYFCCPNVEFFFFWGPHVEFDSVNVSLISLVIVSCFIRAVNTDGSNMWNASSSGAR